jgi:hypothetical protein
MAISYSILIIATLCLSYSLGAKQGEPIYLKPIRLTSYSQDIEEVGEQIRDLQQQYLRDPSSHPSSYILPVYLNHEYDLLSPPIFLRLNTNPNREYLYLVEIYDENEQSISKLAPSYPSNFPSINSFDLKRNIVLKRLSDRNVEIQTNAVLQLVLFFVEALRFYDVSNACQNFLSSNNQYEPLKLETLRNIILNWNTWTLNSIASLDPPNLSSDKIVRIPNIKPLNEEFERRKRKFEKMNKNDKEKRELEILKLLFSIFARLFCYRENSSDSSHYRGLREIRENTFSNGCDSNLNKFSYIDKCVVHSNKILNSFNSITFEKCVEECENVEKELCNHFDYFKGTFWQATRCQLYSLLELKIFQEKNDNKYICASRLGYDLDKSTAIPIMINSVKSFNEKYSDGINKNRYIRISGNLLTGNKLFIDLQAYPQLLGDIDLSLVFNFNLNELILNTYKNNGKY